MTTTELSFNPCFNGTYSLTGWTSHRELGGCMF